MARDRRRVRAPRCAGCGLPSALCLCAELPALATRTRVVLVLHELEVHKPSNTGRLALRCLPNSHSVVRGRGGPGDDAWLRAATRPVLLFPADEAQPIATFAGDEPVTLVVPDGTWSQAARTRRRFPGLAGLPCAHLPRDLVSSYRLRHDPRPSYLSTLQAIAHALDALEGTAGAGVRTALLTVHDRAIDRALYAKGTLPGAQVSGGLPRP